MNSEEEFRSILLEKICIHPQDYTVSQPRRPQSAQRSIRNQNKDPHSCSEEYQKDAKITCLQTNYGEVEFRKPRHNARKMKMIKLTKYPQLNSKPLTANIVMY
jgi:hypothetical protein